MARAVKDSKAQPLEQRLWLSVDKLRKHFDMAEYKYVVLGLIFLKHLSDSFEEMYAKLQSGKFEYAKADPEDKNRYTAENVCFLPTQARWSYLLTQSKQSNIGDILDAAMLAVETDNPILKDVLPRVYAQKKLNPACLEGLLELIGDISLDNTKWRRSDQMGQLFEHCLGEFARAEGRQGGKYYTPLSIVKLQVAMLAPVTGKIYDPYCGAGGILYQAKKFSDLHHGRDSNISFYGQENSCAPIAAGNLVRHRSATLILRGCNTLPIISTQAARLV